MNKLLYISTLLIKNSKTLLLWTFVWLLLLPSTSYAKVLQSGYYKLELNNSHIGYIIQELSSHTDKKSFDFIYYTFTKIDNEISIESLHASSDINFHPLSYKLTQLENKKNTVIDAVFNKTKASIKKITNGNVKSYDLNLRKETFLSSFLTQIMMRHPKGIQVGNKFDYHAVAEEDGRQKKGVAWVKEEKDNRFKILNIFKEEKFITWINSKGETLETLVPKFGLKATLVMQPKHAVKDFPFSKKNIIELFGKLPTGTSKRK